LEVLGKFLNLTEYEKFKSSTEQMFWCEKLVFGKKIISTVVDERVIGWIGKIC
jgi:hypothetical protein